MNLNNFVRFPKRLIVLATILGIGSLAATPALADNHTGSMKSSEMSETSVSQSDSAAGNIVEVASGSKKFSTLVEAVGAAELAETLADSSATYTVFAPTDDAFNQLPDGALEYLLKSENKAVLQRVLSYHVLPNQVTSSEISSGSVETLDSELVTEVTDDGVRVNNASVITADIEASNGIIHAVNRVLLPADLQTALASELGIAEEEIYQ
ncbi:MAG: fasciclin domain-containing protein [Cyanobacteria bacterium P01_G01_bin.67]